MKFSRKTFKIIIIPAVISIGVAWLRYFNNNNDLYELCEVRKYFEPTDSQHVTFGKYFLLLIKIFVTKEENVDVPIVYNVLYILVYSIWLRLITDCISSLYWWKSLSVLYIIPFSNHDKYSNYKKHLLSLTFQEQM
jgi:hypothetical protein